MPDLTDKESLRLRNAALVGHNAELQGRMVLVRHELENERRRADQWQHLAGVYDEIRYALRNASDTPEGHAEFYRDCAELIFGATD